jgi:hypothetical protein
MLEARKREREVARKRRGDAGNECGNEYTKRRMPATNVATNTRKGEEAKIENIQAAGPAIKSYPAPDPRSDERR